jgi:hypothetical protein
MSGPAQCGDPHHDSAGGRCRQDPAASRPSPRATSASGGISERASCFLVTGTVDGLDHLVLDDDHARAVATGEIHDALNTLCGEKTIPETDPARHRGVPCEPCHLNARSRTPPLAARGRPPVRPPRFRAAAVTDRPAPLHRRRP